MSKHTPEPWKCQTHLGCKAIKGGKWASHRQAQYKEIAHTVGLHNESEDLANARRIVACGRYRLTSGPRGVDGVLRGDFQVIEEEVAL